MLFSSSEFVFGFLPAVIAIVVVVSRIAGKAPTIVALILASLIFYGWWSPIFLPLLIASTIANYVIGRALLKKRSRALMILGVAFNLGLLGYFKYAGFFLGILDALTGKTFEIGAITLPLGISFFIFQKIAFIVDAYRGRVDEVNFLHYGLFVVFFPQLIAGPIVHHGEFIKQLRSTPAITVRGADFAIGSAIFAVGLFKKIVIADTLATFADPVFADAGAHHSAVAAWGALVCFTFQIYFDFSGYTDMAVGLARIFGLRLPANFFSPYKATNIIDFWRRWHMTLSRFLRDYLYISLGGNRNGPARRYVNLMITMVLGGLWHGANWTFVFWGAMHGAYLIINHAYHALLRRRGRDPRHTTPAGQFFGRLLTFLAVVFAWLFFRAADWSSALALLQAMAGANGLFPAAPTPFSDPSIFVWLGILLAAVWYTPNTQQWFAAYRPVLGSSLADAGLNVSADGTQFAARSILVQRAFLAFVTISGIIAIIVMLVRQAPVSFIYFVF